MPDLGDALSQAAMIAGAREAAQQPHEATLDSAGGAHASAGDVDIAIDGYRIDREVRRGGQAVVYEGVQLSTGRGVAIKVMTEGPFASARDRARFEREVKILASLDHPSLVSIIDRGVLPQGTPYYVMPFVPGRPLDQHIEYLKQQNGGEPPDAARMLRLFMAICDAVNVAHLRGIIHRDLKPSNIIIDADGQPHILDFGLARTAAPAMTEETNPQKVTLTGQFLGSLPWASPEQAEGVGHHIDTRTDVYALGVILYQMLTGGEFPYEVTGTMAQVLHNIVTVAPTPPSQHLAARQAKQAQKKRRWLRHHPPAVNPTIEAIVLKALDKRRDARYQTAGEFSAEVANYLSGKPTAAHPPKARRNWKPAAIVAAVLLVAAGVVGFFSTRSSSPGSRKDVDVALAPSAATSGAEQAHAELRQLFAIDDHESFAVASTFADGSGDEWVAGEQSAPLTVRGGRVVLDADREKTRLAIRRSLEAPIAPDAAAVNLYLRVRSPDFVRIQQQAIYMSISNARQAFSFEVSAWRNVAALYSTEDPQFKAVSGRAVDDEMATDDGRNRFVSAGQNEISFRFELTPVGADRMRLAAYCFDEDSRKWLLLVEKEEGQLVGGKVTEAFARPQSPYHSVALILKTPTRQDRFEVDAVAVTWRPVEPSQSEEPGPGPRSDPAMAATSITPSVLPPQGELVRAELLHVMRPDSLHVYDVALSPDGSVLAAGRRDGRIDLWRTETAEHLGSLKEGDAGLCNKLAFAPDGRLFATYERGLARIWDLQTKQSAGEFSGHKGKVSGIAVSRDGAMAATGGRDQMLRFWSVKDGSQLHALHEHREGIIDLAMSPDDRWLITVGIDRTILWDVAARRAVHTIYDENPYATRVFFNTAGRAYQVTNGGELLIFDPPARQVLRMKVADTHMGAVAVSADDRLLATGAAEGGISLWDLTAPEPALVQEITTLPSRPPNTQPISIVRDLAFSPDNRYLAAGAHWGFIAIWRLHWRDAE